MTNIYGIEAESAGWLEQEEPKKPECPYCHAPYPEYLRFEDGAVVYRCLTCDTIYKVKSEEIPF